MSILRNMKFRGPLWKVENPGLEKLRPGIKQSCRTMVGCDPPKSGPLESIAPSYISTSGKLLLVLPWSCKTWTGELNFLSTLSNIEIYRTSKYLFGREKPFRDHTLIVVSALIYLMHNFSICIVDEFCFSFSSRGFWYIFPESAGTGMLDTHESVKMSEQKWKGNTHSFYENQYHRHYSIAAETYYIWL